MNASTSTITPSSIIGRIGGVRTGSRLVCTSQSEGYPVARHSIANNRKQLEGRRLKLGSYRVFRGLDRLMSERSAVIGL